MLGTIIYGSKGRMGQALIECLSQEEGLECIAGVDQGDELTEAISRADVLIDFSFHNATAPAARLCADKGVAMVIGTTGHTDDEKKVIMDVAKKIPIVWASNYSTGVNTLFWLTRKAAEILGPGFDLEVVEMHHRMKKDAPSGTAATLVEILAEVRKQQVNEVARYGRQGLVGERTNEEIGVHSLRGGDVVGDHTVVYSTTGERLELTHKASSRNTFARGALRAARWVVGKNPGIYSMEEVLGLT